ncbi:hypothetical protein [Saccharomonospora sp. CUA-673]|uniref:hypothetical protein n=1 Tax=Saccharomonospora sp. CUA-673 TaxID=1904969 RepID=UPI00111540DC|nr:hypothetical protein [Saccharomonospora sp. CUA-673]
MFSNLGLRDPLTQAVYQNKVDEAKESLPDGIDIRQMGDVPKSLWDNASHEQMVETLNSNANSATVAETSEEWVSLGNELTLHQKAVADAINDSLGDWHGEAGDAARRHLAQVAQWLGSTAQGSVLTGRQQQTHSQTLNETQKAMADNPPVPFSASAANARLASISDPGQLAAATMQELANQERSEAAREQAARIMNQFDDTVGSATDMPLFMAPPKLAGAGGASAAAGGVDAGRGDLRSLNESGNRPEMAGAGAGANAVADGIAGATVSARPPAA